MVLSLAPFLKEREIQIRKFFWIVIVLFFFLSCSHISQTSGWLPPADSWDSGGGLNLPYGWEAAQDQEGKTYYVK